MIEHDPTQRPLPPQDHDALYLNLERYHRAADAHRDAMEEAVTCTEFVEGKQWSEQDRLQLEQEGRPCLTFNKIAPLLRLVLGYQRQNRYDMKYLPGNDALSTYQISQQITHAVKQVNAANRYEYKESEVFRDGLYGGRGYFDIRMDYSKNLLGDIKTSVLDPFTVYPDPEADKYEPEHWGHVTVSKWMSLDDILLIYGRQARDLMEGYTAGGSMPIGWSTHLGDTTDDITPARMFGLWKHFSGGDEDGKLSPIGPAGVGYSLFDHLDKSRKVIRVIDTQHWKISKVRYFVDTSSGDMRAIPDDWPLEKIQKVYAWAQMMGQPIDVLDRIERRIRWTVTAADVVLHDDWSPYRSFTVVPYFSYFRRGKTRGLVADLLDPQREVNKRRSAEIHIVGSVAHSGWMYHQDSLDPDQEDYLHEFGSTPGINLKWRGANWQKPERINPMPPPTAMERLETQSADDLKTISGINDSALGQLDIAQSGKAIEARQRQTVIALETLLDNLALTRRLVAEKYLELIQTHYTEERLVRVVGDNGQTIEAILNQRDAAGRIINDVTVGSYTVSIDEVPASATFQAAQFNELLEMFEKGLLPPQLADILIEVSSIPHKQEVKARLQMLMGMQPGQPMPGQEGAAPMQMPMAPPQPWVPGQPQTQQPGLAVQQPPRPLPAPVQQPAQQQ